MSTVVDNRYVPFLLAHAIRHASITEVSKRTNGNLPQTQKFGRHSNPTATSRYIDEHTDTFN